MFYFVCLKLFRLPIFHVIISGHHLTLVSLGRKKNPLYILDKWALQKLIITDATDGGHLQMASISIGSEGYLEESPPLYKLLSDFKTVQPFNSGSSYYPSAKLNITLPLSACVSHTVTLIPSSRTSKSIRISSGW